MKQIRAYGWALVTCIVILALAVLAAYSGSFGAEAAGEGIDNWYYPLLLLFLLLMFGGVTKVNQPLVALGAILLSIVCGVFLYMPPPIEQFAWYYPLLLGFLLLLFLRVRRSDSE